jgi:hypothetical protein
MLKLSSVLRKKFHHPVTAFDMQKLCHIYIRVLKCALLGFCANFENVLILTKIKERERL